MSTYIVDLETTNDGGPEGDSPEAHWNNNKVIIGGWKTYAFGSVSQDLDALIKSIMDDVVHCRHCTLVGHNLKFDLKYLIRDYPTVPWAMLDYVCTMHRTYRLSGHKHKFSGLEHSCGLYGIAFTKGLDLKAILSSGLKMTDIPLSDLEPYLDEDVIATEALYAAQVQQFTNDHIALPLSNHTLPLAAMELAGLPLDKKKCEAKMKSLMNDEKQHIASLFKHATDNLEWNDGVPIIPDDIKVNAPRTISYLLTGSPTTGLVKGKRSIVLKGQPLLLTADITKYWPGVIPTHLGYPLPVAKLQEIANEGHRLPLSVMAYRLVTKLMGTYYGPFLHRASTQGHVYPKMHMCSTATGRGSSAEPNGQNMPPEARECFVNEHGIFHDIDFKQLEVCALAACSGDPMLIRDLQSGVDLHFETGKKVMGWKVPADMTKKTRTIVKTVNFGLIYGGGATALARQSGASVKVVKDLIKGFYARYPRVAEWQKEFYEEVVKNMTASHIDEGEQVYTSNVTLPISNREFHFREQKSPVWLIHKTGRKFSFKPTETKNYPVQGFAGGDIVMDVLVELYRELESEPNTCIRMSVHDSILIDTDLGADWITTAMEAACQIVQLRYSLPFELKFDLESSKHWQ